MKVGWWAVLASVVCCSCTSTYPYLITTDGCNCERYVLKDEEGRFEAEFTATYRVSDRIESTIEIVFRNTGPDTLSLRQSYVRGTSANVRYPFNDRFQPTPYVAIPPGGRYAMTLRGTDSDLVDEPWHKIAGENVTLEIRGLLYGQSVIGPLIVTLVPLNPKLSS